MTTRNEQSTPARHQRPPHPRRSGMDNASWRWAMVSDQDVEAAPLDRRAGEPATSGTARPTRRTRQKAPVASCHEDLPHTGRTTEQLLQHLWMSGHTVDDIQRITNQPRAFIVSVVMPDDTIAYPADEGEPYLPRYGCTVLKRP